MLPEILLLASLVMVPPQVSAKAEPVPNPVLATHTMSMEDRYNNQFVNNVFKDNILLSVHYMAGDVISKADISWEKIEKPFNTRFTLIPGQEFAFHGHTLASYSKNVVKTMNSRFFWDEGYKSDGYLVGDGVCHLASLINWTARDAGLLVYAPSNHNFAKINDVPKEYGVAIMSPNPMGNLYITNNLEKPITFVFEYNGTTLSVRVIKEN